MSEWRRYTKRIEQMAGSPGIAPGYPPIERPDLVASVTDSIRRQILDGIHAPGSVLPAQGRLASEFKVSLNVIREAMRNLRSLGMVNVSQGRCPRVRAVNPEASLNAFTIMLSHCKGSLRHLMESRLPLEIRVATLVAARARPEDIARIAQTIADMKGAEDPKAISQCDQAFHSGLAKATSNPLLRVMVDALAGLQCRLLQEAHADAGITEGAIAEHSRILEAVRRHDEEAAGQAMREHLEGVLRKIPNNQDLSAPLSESGVRGALGLAAYPVKF
jgi:GntR family transcriptional regulator, transcriptional repressor for pyruvate dehydrogenase complex